MISSPSTAEALSALCRQCGLCCDGTLFARVVVRPPEAEALEGKGVEVAQRADGTQALAQPCAALRGRSCAIYADRPQGCRSFVCNLYRAVSEGEVSAGEAADVVAEAQRAVAAVADVTFERDPAPGVMERARCAAAAGTLSSQAERRWRQAEALLRRHFLGRATTP